MTHIRHILLGAAAGLFSAGSIASAEAATAANDWYLGLSGDLTWMRHSDLGGGGNVSLGHRFDNFRLEAEAGYHHADGDRSFNSTHYFNYMANAYYDFKSLAFNRNASWQISPYVGGGVGVAQMHFGSGSPSFAFDHSVTRFAYEGMAGLNFVSASSPNIEWSLGYRYLGTNDVNIHSNNIELGLRFHF